MKIITFSASNNKRADYFRRFDTEMGVQSKSMLIRELFWKLPGLPIGPGPTAMEDVAGYTLARYRYKTNNRYQRVLFKWCTWLSCWYLAAVTRRFLATQKPDLIAVYNGYSALIHTVIWVARKMDIPVAYFETGLLPDTTTCDGRGINYFNSVPREPNFFSGTDWPSVGDVRTNLIARKPKKGKVVGAPVAIPNRFIFVPFQVDTDSQILVNSPWIKNMRQLFELIQLLSADPAGQDWVFVLKEHPSSSASYSDLEANDQIVFANYNNTQELIEKCEAIITINSSVGIEGLLFGKRVITLGNAFYNIEGIVKHADSKTQLARTIKSILHWQPDERAIRNLVYYLKNHYLIPDNYRNPTEKHWTALRARLEQIASGQ